MSIKEPAGFYIGSVGPLDGLHGVLQSTLELAQLSEVGTQLRRGVG
jgi:hypothetical protein